MTESEFVEKNRSAVDEYVSAYRSAKAAKKAFVLVSKSDDCTEEAERDAAQNMRESENLRDRLEFDLVIAFAAQNGGRECRIAGALMTEATK